MSITLQGNGRRIIFDESKLLNRGGNSNVFKGYILETGDHVAVKVPHRNLIIDEIVLRRLSQEASLKYEHPNLVKIIDFIFDPVKNIYHLVSEFVEGKTLDMILNEAKQKGERLSFSFVKKIITDIASALQFLHSQEPIIIHRDIKPSNIMITNDGKTKLMDLGIAKIFDTTGQNQDITKVGTILGTYHYIPPEQIKPAQYGMVNPQSDIYSLGVTMYEALSNKLPFTGFNEFELYQNIINVPFPPINTLNEDINNILKRCLEKNRKYRYQSCVQLINDLKQLDDDGVALIQKKKFDRKLTYSILGLSILFSGFVGYQYFLRPITGSINKPMSYCNAIPAIFPNPINCDSSIFKNIELAKQDLIKQKSIYAKWLFWANNPNSFNGIYNTKIVTTNDFDKSDPPSRLLVKMIQESPNYSKTKKLEMINEDVNWIDKKGISEINYFTLLEDFGIKKVLQDKINSSLEKYTSYCLSIADTLALCGKFNLLRELADELDLYLLKARVSFLLNDFERSKIEIGKWLETNNPSLESNLLQSDMEAFRSNFESATLISNEILDSILTKYDSVQVKRSIINTRLLMGRNNIIYDSLFIDTMLKYKMNAFQYSDNVILKESKPDSCLTMRLAEKKEYASILKVYKKAFN